MENRWWDYISKVHTQCYNVINESCSERAHKQLGLSWEATMKCVHGSFIGPADRTASSVSNSIIDKEIGYWKEFGTSVFPSIVINSKTYRGQLEPLSVFNAICAGFENPPDDCLPTLHRTASQEGNAAIQPSDGISASAIVMIVVAVIIINVIAVVLCRRSQKRQMHGEM